MSILFPYLTYTTFDTQEQYAALIASTLGLSALLYFLYWLHTKSTFRSLSIKKVMQLEGADFVRYLCVLLSSRGYTHFRILSNHSPQITDMLGTQENIQQYIRVHMCSTPPDREEVNAVHNAQRHLHVNSSVLVCRSSVSARMKKFGEQLNVLIIDAYELRTWIQSFSAEAVL